MLGLLLIVLPLMLVSAGQASTNFPRDFAPHDGFVTSYEKPLRSEICLNGSWQFQPTAAPENHNTEQGPTSMPAPNEDAWDKTPIRIPSPWNVNLFAKSDGGDYKCFPSYPESWENAHAGWLRRSFKVPANWKNKDVIIRFEAVAGSCEVFVNGQSVGKHFDTFMPFEVHVTDYVKFGADNELKISVIQQDMFSFQGKYGGYTYPTGSFWGNRIGGIWQDVYLLARSKVNVHDVYVKPLVDKDTLQLKVEIRNNTGKYRNVKLGGKVYPWVSDAGKHVALAPEAKWHLGEKPVLNIPSKTCKMEPGGIYYIDLQQKVNKKLAFWTPDSPKLYGVIVELTEDGKTVDRQYVRFGWRQFSIKGKNFMLNGKPIQLLGDAWHFMGVPQMTRRYAYSWFRALKDANANAVRLHAQPYPGFYLDVADEMGIMVLDESAVWASHCSFNYDHPDTWDRFSYNIESMVLRDRNHPSVFGWSIANEINGALGVSRTPEDYRQKVNDRFGEFAKRVKELDPTRPWISSDGDEDMDGRLPVAIAHYGDLNLYEKLSQKERPFGVGETTCAYYGTPRHVAGFNGDRAYESFLGRMEGVAMESYELIAKGQRPKAAFCSVFNLAWYGLKPLPIGLSDISKAPELTDGIFFGKYKEGKPGMQPERLGPYSSTFNPGYDKKLPLYEPWPMFDAIKAAYAPGGPAPCEWDHYPEDKKVKSDSPTPTIDRVKFIGDTSGQFNFSLYRAGVQMADEKDTNSDAGLILIEGASLKPDSVADVKNVVDNALDNGKTVFVWGLSKDNLASVNAILPAAVELTGRDAVSLVPKGDSPLTSSLKLEDLYFAEAATGKIILEAGLAGPFVEKGKVLLEACNTDWRRWNGRGEDVKTGSVVRSEMEAKPSGAALVEMNVGKGRLLVCNLLSTSFSKQHLNLVRNLMSNLGVKLEEPKQSADGILDAGGVVHETLILGNFNAENYDAALDTDFIGGETSVAPKLGDKIGDMQWQKIKVRDDMAMNLLKSGIQGPTDNSAAYLSFWIYSPRPLDQLLAQPDLPRVSLFTGSDDGMKIWLNGKLLLQDRGLHPINPTEHRSNDLPLKEGWNHFLVKVVNGTGDWQFAAQFQSSDPRFLSTLRSGVEHGENK